MYSIISGVLDNDVKGLLGRGTQFWLEVRGGLEPKTPPDMVVIRHEFDLFDELEGKFDRRAIAAPYLAANKIEDQKAGEVADAEKKRVKEVAVAMRTAVGLKPELHAIMLEVVAAEPKAIAEYRAGKEKALNALVGKIIGSARKVNLTGEAGTITVSLKNHLLENP